MRDGGEHSESTALFSVLSQDRVGLLSVFPKLKVTSSLPTSDVLRQHSVQFNNGRIRHERKGSILSSGTLSNIHFQEENNRRKQGRKIKAICKNDMTT